MNAPETEPEFAPATSWLAMTESRLQKIEPGLRGWVAETGLLTRRLHASCADGFALSVECQSRVALGSEEADLLGCTPQQALLREIELRAAGETCVYARTLVPDGTLRACPWLADLGDSPLGEALSHRPNVLRSGFDLAQLSPGDDLYAAAGGDARMPALWARRSAFRLSGAGLLVYEVFLPAVARVG